MARTPQALPPPASVGHTSVIVKSPRAFSGCGYLYLQPHFSYLLEPIWEIPAPRITRERPLIDAAQQVRHLKDRGVRFELTNEREAERFPRESNFFFKVKAFAKCFSRYSNPGSERFGSYISLDFAYLAELTWLDHHLRESVLSLTLDIEHYMKVDLNRMVMDAGDDPYELMAPSSNPSTKER